MTVSHPRRPESSVTLLREAKISYCFTEFLSATDDTFYADINASKKISDGNHLFNKNHYSVLQPNGHTLNGVINPVLDTHIPVHWAALRWATVKC
jgi:hypothetical protein